MPAHDGVLHTLPVGFPCLQETEGHAQLLPLLWGLHATTEARSPGGSAQPSVFSPSREGGRTRPLFPCIPFHSCLQLGAGRRRPHGEATDGTGWEHRGRRRREEVIKKNKTSNREHLNPRGQVVCETQRQPLRLTCYIESSQQPAGRKGWRSKGMAVSPQATRDGAFAAQR